MVVVEEKQVVVGVGCSYSMMSFPECRPGGLCLSRLSGEASPW